MAIYEALWPWVYKIGIAAAIILGAKIVVTVVNKTIFKIDKLAEEKGIKRLDFSKDVVKMIQTVVRYVVYFIAVMFLMYFLGLNEVVFAFITSAGIVGLAIGFAAKDVVSNLISGALIAVDRPFSIGDDVKIGTLEGRVKQITLRSTKIKSFDGKYIIIPNSKLATDPIVNYSKSLLRRIELDFEVEVGTDIKKVRNIITTMFKDIKWISTKKEDDVIITNVTRLGISFQVRVWTKNEKLWDKKSELFEVIDTKLRKSDIKITMK
jgi:small conductance mechanosensitive channel